MYEFFLSHPGFKPQAEDLSLIPLSDSYSHTSRLWNQVVRDSPLLTIMPSTSRLPLHPRTMPRQAGYFLFCHQIILLPSSSQRTEPRKKAIEKASAGLLIPSIPVCFVGGGETPIQHLSVSFPKSMEHHRGQTGPVGSFCLRPPASEGSPN